MPPRSSLTLTLGAAAVAVLLALFPGIGTGQRPAGARPASPARISEEIRTLATYPFDEPNRVPILTRDRRLYPYHSFEGYATASEPREWKVVKLENDLIEVFVLPEVGGKVWGAVVKATGHEFIYRNEVMKFRNIALRGPWTSGGIELNFGVIGHTPATATPVDYLLRENPDGSVSCWVGTMDLPSRTVWRVEIRLPPDEAVFETNVFWYNPTPLEQPYYNWMTAAAFARPDLEMSMPGNAYLQHSGQVEAWPEDEEGRYLPLYANNTFGGHKSYHVVGELHDFFGGYYHGEGWGFGHWARYEDMPGQKLWLWALSREGGVWEDLLTDTDGQYVEFQAGRLFVQYSPGSDVNPITQAGFEPLSSSRWSERWFPVEGIGGISQASAFGALHVSAEGARLSIGVNAFRNVEDTLWVWSGREESASAAHLARTGSPLPEGWTRELLAAIPLRLAALEPFRTEVSVPADLPFRIEIPALDLVYTSDPRDGRLSRSFDTPPDAWTGVSDVDRTVFQARELMKARRYPEARALFQGALEAEPRQRDALLAMAELDYRRGYMDPAAGHARRVLELDAYDAHANFLAGLAHRAMGSADDARDAFGWAARSVAFRAAARVQLAELAILEAERRPSGYGEAIRHARLALEHDRSNVPAWQALALIGRKTGDGALAREAREALLALDPLQHFVAAERYLEGSGEDFIPGLRGEFPEQEVLELAIGYARLGQKPDALKLLEAWEEAGKPPHPLHRAWAAALSGDPSRLADPGRPDFVFPFRTETMSVLSRAAADDPSWIWRYLLALNVWALDRAPEEAEQLFEGLGQTPDYAPFYASRARFLQEIRGTDPEPDLRRAVALDPTDRTLHVLLIQHLQASARWDHALEAAENARERFPDDFNLQLLQARSLIHLALPVPAIALLASAHVLPSENGRESHRLWEQAHLMAALDAAEADDWETARGYATAALEWPENLGQGRPYQPEERLARFLLGEAERRTGSSAAAREAFQAVLEGTPGLEEALAGRPLGRRLARLDLLALPALEALGRREDAERLRAAWAAHAEKLMGETSLDLDARLFARAAALGGD